MVVFHLTWDLAHFGWIDSRTPFAPGFRWFGHSIAAGFLLLAGLSLVLARGRGGDPLWRRPAFWFRWLRIVAAAAAITLVSLYLFPGAPIFFGILHCIALSSLIALAFIDAPPPLTLLAAGLSFAAPLLAAPRFNAPIFWWSGLSSFYPPSNDYRPLFPYLGLVLIGVVFGRLAEKRPLRAREEGGRAGGSLFSQALGFCGRHSLAFYLIHQPILYGLVAALTLAAPPPIPQTPEQAFVAQCIAQCRNKDAEAGFCQNACVCVVQRAKAENLWQALAQDRLTDPQKARVHDAAIACYADAASKINP
jgi:uncharacterized membrane protein